MIIAVLTILLPIFLGMGIGYAWVRIGRPFDNSTLAAIATDLALPCLILSSLINAEISISAFATMVLAATASLAAIAVIGSLLLGASRLSLRTYLPSVTWGNAAFLGIPLVIFAFGQNAAGYAAAFCAVSLVFNMSLVAVITAGRESVVSRLCHPLILAVVAGVLIRLLHVNVPHSALVSVQLVGDMAVPLTLMLVGSSLARLKPSALAEAFIFSVLRMGAGASVGIVMGFAFDLPPLARSVLILQCAMPVAVLSYVVAQRWGDNPEAVAGLVVVSTWISLICLPVMIGLMADI